MALKRKQSDPVSEEQKVQLLQYVNDDRHFSMLRSLHMADYITLLNGFSGVMSIFASLNYCLGDARHHGYIYASIVWMVIGTLADVMDGKVARWRQRASLVGQELDSLADLISFGVAPAMCAFTIGLRTNIDMLVLSLFVMCGLTRLARFNVSVGSMKKDKTGKIAHFEGTPIPTSLGLVTIMAVWVRLGWTLENMPFGIVAENTMFKMHPVVLMFAMSGAAMASKSLKVPKL